MNTLFSYYLQRLSFLFPLNEYSYYFGGYPDSNKRLGCITCPGIGPRRGSICLPYVKIQNVNTFLTVNYCFGFSASYFLEMVMPIRQVGTQTQTRMWIGSLTFPDMGFMRG